MLTDRAVVWGVATLVVATVLVSGPLVPGVSVATEPEPVDYGEGNATVAEVTLPATATVEDADYGAANYQLTVPAATVRFATLTGHPTLSYSLAIPTLNYSRTTTHFLDSSHTRFEATLQSDTLDSDRVSRDRYRARLSVVLRDSGGGRMVAQRNVTVEVAE